MATAFAPKMSQVLTTPEPHYIPGYTGYCPHYKFSVGKTYGQQTSQLLTSPEVPRPCQRVLQLTCCYTGYCPHYKFSVGKTYGQQTSQLLTSPEVPRPCQRVLQLTCWSCRGTEPQDLPGEPGSCWGAGAQPLSSIVIPGYTGFIPRAQHFFAKTCSEICKEARSDFAKQRLRAPGKEQTWLKTQPLPQDPEQESDVRQIGPQRSPYSMEDDDPQKYFISGFIPRAQHFFAKTCSEICKEARSDFAKQRLRAPGKEQTWLKTQPLPQDPEQESDVRQIGPQRSPYSMEDDDPQKYFISGFTGFVPRAWFLIGTGYPVTTNWALLEFSQMALKKGGRSETKEGSTILPPLGKIYPMEMGLLPHYAGYVPGYKLQFGHTYGHLTHNTLGLRTLKKQMPD
nr:PREDICTED: protein FAM166B [Apteryx mantelli mantelli]